MDKKLFPEKNQGCKKKHHTKDKNKKNTRTAKLERKSKSIAENADADMMTAYHAWIRFSNKV